MTSEVFVKADKPPADGTLPPMFATGLPRALIGDFPLRLERVGGGGCERSVVVHAATIADRAGYRSAHFRGRWKSSNLERSDAASMQP